MAHIVAFSAEGPRGKEPSPAAVHDIDNLMLLCSRCHKLIDDATAHSRYSPATLRKHKHDHEERIYRLTEAKPERKTKVLQLLSRVGGQPTAIPPSDVWDAVAPRYPSDSTGCVIDLNQIEDGSEAFYIAATKEIDRRIDQVLSPGLADPAPQHFSVFALAPMPLLVYLGGRLSNKIPTEFFQRHRDTKNWTWKDSVPQASYSAGELRAGARASTSAAILLSLTAPVHLRDLDGLLAPDLPIHELRLSSEEPNADFLKTRGDLDRFRRTYQALIARLTEQYPQLGSVLLFPIAPAPVCVIAGFEVFPRVSPLLRVHDRDRDSGWYRALDVQPGRFASPAGG